jgi:hypothetical protein
MKEDLSNRQQDVAKLKEEIRARQKQGTPLVVPPSPPNSPVKREKRFPLSIKKGKDFDVPDGIVAHLARQCGGNVHDCTVVDVTSPPPQWTPSVNKNATQMKSGNSFCSVCRFECVPHIRNHWPCSDFKDQRIVPTLYAICSEGISKGSFRLKGWLVEPSVEGTSWREVDHKENNNELNEPRITRTFAVAASGPRRFIRLANISHNHNSTNSLNISAWEIFGTLFE